MSNRSNQTRLKYFGHPHLQRAEHLTIIPPQYKFKKINKLLFYNQDAGLDSSIRNLQLSQNATNNPHRTRLPPHPSLRIPLHSLIPLHRQQVAPPPCRLRQRRNHQDPLHRPISLTPPPPLNPHHPHQIRLQLPRRAEPRTTALLVSPPDPERRWRVSG